MKHDVKQKYYTDLYGNVYYTAQSFHFSLCCVLDGNLRVFWKKNVEDLSYVSINAYLGGVCLCMTKDILAIIRDGSQQQTPLALQ